MLACVVRHFVAYLKAYDREAYTRRTCCLRGSLLQLQTQEILPTCFDPILVVEQQKHQVARDVILETLDCTIDLPSILGCLQWLHSPSRPISSAFANCKVISRCAKSGSIVRTHFGKQGLQFRKHNIHLFLDDALRLQIHSKSCKP